MRKGIIRAVNTALICVNAAILLLSGVLCAVIFSFKSEYASDSARTLWEGKMHYALISLYTAPEYGLNTMSLYELRRGIEDKLTENSVKADEGSAGRLWIDAASGEYGSVTVTGNSGSCEAVVTGTAGDYFIFHPEKLISGSYYTDDDTNIDRVILDKQCSWQIFGAVDTVGMQVTVGGKVLFVAGVVDTPEGERDIAAYGSTPRIYMPFDTMNSLSGGGSVMTAYEVCMPNIVKDFAYNIMTELNSAPETGSTLVDQTGRFDMITLFEGFSEIPESVMTVSGIKYPWYENRTRSAELIARILAGPAVYILIIPAISLVYALFVLAKFAGRGAAAIKKKADDAYQKKLSEKYKAAK